MYELRFSPSAERYFKKLKDKTLKGTFEKALLEIAEGPYCGSQKQVIYLVSSDTSFTGRVTSINTITSSRTFNTLRECNHHHRHDKGDY